MSDPDDDLLAGDFTFDDSSTYIQSRSKRLQSHSSHDKFFDDEDDTSNDLSSDVKQPVDKTKGQLILIRRSKDMRAANRFERPTRKITFTIKFSSETHHIQEQFEQHGENPLCLLDPLAKEGDFVKLDRSVGESTGSGKLGSVLWKVDEETMLLMKEELEAQAAMQKRAKNKRIKLDADRILDPEIGLNAIVLQRFPKIKKFKNVKGSEVEDLSTLLGAYREWCTLLHPGMNFRRVVTAIDKLTADRSVSNALHTMRDEHYDAQYAKALVYIRAKKEANDKKAQELNRAEDASLPSHTIPDTPVRSRLHQNISFNSETISRPHTSTNTADNTSEENNLDPLAIKRQLFQMDEVNLEATRERLDKNLNNITAEDEEAQRLFDSLVSQNDSSDEDSLHYA